MTPGRDQPTHTTHTTPHHTMSDTPPRDPDPETGQSDDQTRTVSPSLLQMAMAILKRVLTGAGAPSESESERDGFLSHHAESHAAGMGIAAGYLYASQGEARLFGLVYAAAVYGRSQVESGKRRRILRDIVTEWHYALGGLVLGVVLGLAQRRFFPSLPALDLSDVVPTLLAVPIPGVTA